MISFLRFQPGPFSPFPRYPCPLFPLTLFKVAPIRKFERIDLAPNNYNLVVAAGSLAFHAVAGRFPRFFEMFIAQLLRASKISSTHKDRKSEICVLWFPSTRVQIYLCVLFEGTKAGSLKHRVSNSEATETGPFWLGADKVRFLLVWGGFSFTLYKNQGVDNTSQPINQTHKPTKTPLNQPNQSKRNQSANKNSNQPNQAKPNQQETRPSQPTEGRVSWDCSPGLQPGGGAEVGHAAAAAGGLACPAARRSGAATPHAQDEDVSAVFDLAVGQNQWDPFWGRCTTHVSLF